MAKRIRMQKRRLLKLAGLLEKDAENPSGVRFDLRAWAVPSDDDNIHPMFAYQKRQKTINVDCSTTACAVGLACISGVFKDQGLTFGFEANYYGFALVPVFNRRRNFGAVEEFFGLTPAQAEYLFVAGRYPKRKSRGAAGERAVAQRIRDMAAGKIPPEKYNRYRDV